MEKPTDSETADISDLLTRIQEILEERKKNYSPVAIINVLINLSSRYAAVSKWPIRNYLKICGATYKTQKTVIEDMARERDDIAQA